MNFGIDINAKYTIVKLSLPLSTLCKLKAYESIYVKSNQRIIDLKTKPNNISNFYCNIMHKKNTKLINKKLKHKNL